MSRKTLDVLKWAKNESEKNEIVKYFWEKLCSAVNEKPSASPDKVFSEIRLYGSNTLLKSVRPEGVSYHEVAADVADKLAGWAFWQKSPYGYASIESCERFVLERMKPEKNDLEKLNTKGDPNLVVRKATVAGAAAVAVNVAHQVGLQVARNVSLRIVAQLNIILGGMAVVDLAGPAYRCTIPAVTYTALLRKVYEGNKRGL